MEQKQIALIGCGKLGKSILRGLQRSEGPLASKIRISVARESSKAEILSEFGITAETNNSKVVDGADLIVLATKPHQIEEVLSKIVRDDRPRKWVSLAAGLPVASIENRVAKQDQVFRAMPNTSAALQSSMTLLYSQTPNDSAVTELFRKVGEVLWLKEENMIERLTPLTASSPAFFYLICEGFEDYLRDLNLSAAERSQLIGQTLLGAGRKILNDPRPSAELLSEVATPGGMTLEGLRKLSEFQAREAFHQALVAAFEKSKSLSKSK